MMMLVSVLPCSLVASAAAFAMPVTLIHMTSAPNRLTRHVEMYAMPEDNQHVTTLDERSRWWQIRPGKPAGRSLTASYDW